MQFPDAIRSLTVTRQHMSCRHSQVGAVLTSNTWGMGQMPVSCCDVARDRRCDAPEMSATLRLKYSSGEGRLSLTSGEKGAGTSEMLLEDMASGGKEVRTVG